MIYRLSLSVGTMVLMDAGVSVMESDDRVQWRVLTRPDDPSQGSSRRCHLPSSQWRLPRATFNSCLYHLG
jgi:hypothetical protein